MSTPYSSNRILMSSEHNRSLSGPYSPLLGPTLEAAIHNNLGKLLLRMGLPG